MTDLTLLAFCGLYCGACSHYRASLPEGQHLMDEAARRGRTQADFTCRGCRSGSRYIHPGCANCAIRACAEAKGLLHCGLCPELTCERLAAFQHDGHIHHLDVIRQLEALAQAGPQDWLAEQARLWTCICGAAYSWYETICVRCGAQLGSYAQDAGK